jgi:hypothetical protein
VIADPQELQDARDGWEFVRHTRNIIVGNCDVAAVTGAWSFNQAGMRDLCFNLLLTSAFSVLEDVLKQLRDEGVFVSQFSGLKQLMKNSRPSIPWVDWKLIDDGRDDRNKSVHALTYLPHAKCRDYLAALEIELFAWGVLASTTPQLWHW